MSERDYLEDTFTVQHSGVFDFNGLYRLLRKWFKQRRYKLTEPAYKDLREEGGRNVKMKWIARRKVTDYARYVIETEISLRNFEEVMVKKRKMAKADLSVSLLAYIDKDYEETWYRKSFYKFMREVYDKFAQGSQYESMERDLKRDLRGIADEIKTYLNLFKRQD